MFPSKVSKSVNFNLTKWDISSPNHATGVFSAQDAPWVEGGWWLYSCTAALGLMRYRPGKRWRPYLTAGSILGKIGNLWKHTSNMEKTQDLGYLGVQKRTMEVAVWVDWTCKNGQFHRQQTCGLKQQKIDDLCPWEIPTAKRWTLSRW